MIHKVFFEQKSGDSMGRLKRSQGRIEKKRFINAFYIAILIPMYIFFFSFYLLFKFESVVLLFISNTLSCVMCLFVEKYPDNIAPQMTIEESERYIHEREKYYVSINKVGDLFSFEIQSDCIKYQNDVILETYHDAKRKAEEVIKADILKRVTFE